jgi:hypothetical protein
LERVLRQYPGDLPEWREQWAYGVCGGQPKMLVRRGTMICAEVLALG